MGPSHYSGEIGFQIFELYFHCTVLTAILLNSSNFFIFRQRKKILWLLMDLKSSYLILLQKLKLQMLEEKALIVAIQ
jgi:hypothetical protein